MDPMNFFNQKNTFPFNQISQPPIPPEYLHELKNMVKQYNSVLNDDFWKNINGLRTHSKKNIKILPIDIWECEESIYLSIAAPGLSNLNDAKLLFHNDQVLTLKISSHSIKPAGAQKLLKSEMPQKAYEREIYLQKPVKISDYSSSYEHGVLTYTFKKMNADLNIPFDF